MCISKATNVLDSVLEVFTSVADWIPDAVTNVIPMFYTAEAGLTFLGVLAVAGLAISVFFLVMGIVQNFLHFRG